MKKYLERTVNSFCTVSFSFPVLIVTVYYNLKLLPTNGECLRGSLRD